jgi:hypothetical protein
MGQPAKPLEEQKYIILSLPLEAGDPLGGSFDRSYTAPFHRGLVAFLWVVEASYAVLFLAICILAKL